MEHMNEVRRLTERIEILERTSSRLRRFNACLLLAAVAVTAVAARPAEPSDAKFATLEAKRIVVRNESGDELVIGGYDGVATGIAIDLNRKRPGGKTIVLARLASFGGAGQLSLNDSDNTREIMLDVSGITSLMSAAGKGPALFMKGEGPNVYLQDRNGRSATLGSTRLTDTDGSEIIRPASSLTLISDRRVVWSAP